MSARFYGVYLLCSESLEPRYRGKCYIGFTVDPNRRINQHNRGLDFGGAKKTNNKGPWQMVLIVHGFPNNITALQFEWAWQQPMHSTRLKTFADLKRKKPKESHFQYQLRILSRMLQVGPWQRLPLNIAWLNTAYQCEFPLDETPPRHMKIIYGDVSIEELSQRNTDDSANAMTGSQQRQPQDCLCDICIKKIDISNRIACSNVHCPLIAHVVCLASHMLKEDSSSRGHYVPIAGRCPLCETKLFWAQLVLRRSQDTTKNIDLADVEEEENIDFQSDESDLDAD